MSFLSAERYRVDLQCECLQSNLKHSIANETRCKAREDREQLEHDMRTAEHEFAKTREAREKAEHLLKMDILTLKKKILQEGYDSILTNKAKGSLFVPNLNF